MATANPAAPRPSVLSGVWGEALAEFFGTMILILFGDGCVAVYGLFNNSQASIGANSWVVIIFGWGLAVMLGIYVAGAVSGAHLNPAVTLAFAVKGDHPWSKVIPYWVAQVAGAFVAALILYFVYQGALANALAANGLHSMSDIAQPLTYGGKGFGWVFYTGHRTFVGLFGAFADEFVGTALLVGLIFAIVDVRNQPVQGNINPLIIGLLIVAIGASFGANTGYAINPARDFGPRLWIAIVSGGASFSADNYYFWVPIVAPLLGGVVGGLIWQYTIAKVLIARGLMKSGAAVEKGEAVREPAVE